MTIAVSGHCRDGIFYKDILLHVEYSYRKHSCNNGIKKCASAIISVLDH